MSTVPMVVRFPDGVVKYGYFNDTSDRAYELLFATPCDAKKYLLDMQLDSRDIAVCEGPVFAVEVAVAYSDMAWRALASPQKLIGPSSFAEFFDIEARGETAQDPAELLESIFISYPTWARHALNQLHETTRQS